MVDDKKVMIGRIALSLVDVITGFLIVGMSSSWWTAIGVAAMIGGESRMQKVFVFESKEEKK